MKKFFALALAVAMVMSMAAVASAAATLVVDDKVGLYGPFDYSADDDKFIDRQLTYGDTAYYGLFIDGDAVTDYALVEKLKVKVAYEMGEDLVESVNVLKKKNVDTGEYNYFIGFKTVSKSTTADADVIGTLEISRKELKKDDQILGVYNGKIDDEEIDFAFNLFYERWWKAEGDKYVYIDGDESLDYDTEYALKFDCDEEVELTFGDPKGAQNEGTFTVDVSGQGKVFLKFNTKADEAIVAANPGVKMYFVNFNNVKFNRTGEFMYEMEDGVAAYKVVDGALVEIPGAEYDAADEAFYFNTRVLESYVFADAELVNPVVEAPVVEAPAVTNPTTGA